MFDEVERLEHQCPADLIILNPTVNRILTRYRNSDFRCYNIPIVDEVAMIFHNTGGEWAFERDSEIFIIGIIKNRFYTKFNRHYWRVYSCTLIFLLIIALNL